MEKKLRKTRFAKNFRHPDGLVGSRARFSGEIVTKTRGTRSKSGNLNEKDEIYKRMISLKFKSVQQLVNCGTTAVKIEKKKSCLAKVSTNYFIPIKSKEYNSSFENPTKLPLLQRAPVKVFQKCAF